MSSQAHGRGDAGARPVIVIFLNTNNTNK